MKNVIRLNIACLHVWLNYLVRGIMMRGHKVGYGSFVPLCHYSRYTAGTFVPFAST